MKKLEISVFNRVEKKFLLTRKQCDAIIEDLQPHMTIDDHAKMDSTYQTLSLYYDTPYNELACASFFKQPYKEKLRLRTYEIPQLNTPVFLEIKKKVNGISNKRRSVLPLSEAYDFLENRRVPESCNVDNPQILREIQAMALRYDLWLRPSALISYERMAFKGCEDTELRISFDFNPQGRTYDLRLESGGYGEPLLDPELVIMEAKFMSCMPLWLAKLLASHQAFARDFSKYRSIYITPPIKAYKQ